jgi:tetratricopeptide (TPR) repeat protein
MTFRKRRRIPIVPILLYLSVVAAAAFVIWQRESIQDQVLTSVGPEPTATTSPVTLMNLGSEAYYAGRLDEAQRYYEQAAEIDPSLVEALVAVSRTNTLDYIQSRDTTRLEQAIVYAEQAIEVAPEDPRGHAALARALTWSGEYTAAANAASRSIEIAPDYALGHAYLADAYNELGRFRQAITEAERAIELDPYSVDARRNYAWILATYGDYRNAIIQYEQALRIEPNRVDIMYELALNYKWSGEVDRSVEMFNDIVRRVPEQNQGTFFVEIGIALFEVRDDGAAQEYFSTAIDLECNRQESDPEICPVTEGLWDYEDNEYWEWRENPTVPDTIYQKAWTSLGQVYFVRRNYEDAVDIFEVVINWNEEQGRNAPIEAYYVTASAYHALNECDRGIPYAEKALELWEERRDELDGEVDAGMQNILLSILRSFVLCRDASNDPYLATGPGFENGFPVGYEEPDIEISIEDITGVDDTEEQDDDDMDDGSDDG